MAMQRKWIQAATIAVDEETGAILVSSAAGGVEVVGLKDAGGDQVNPATKESVDAVAAALADPAQAGEAEAAAALVVAALGSPAQEDGDLAGVKSNTDALASGLPAFGTDAAGQDAHAKVLDCPSRVTHHLIAFAEINAAILSLNGGTTDHVYVPAGGGVALDGLAIPASAEVHAKNAVGGSDYANLRLMVW